MFYGMSNRLDSERDYLVSDLKKYRRKNKTLSEKRENKKDLERDTEDMIRDDLACFNLALGLIQPYTKIIKYWDKKKNGKSCIPLS